MAVKNFMAKKVVTASPEASLKELREYFENLKIHHIVIVDEGKVKGVVSDRDVLRCSSPFLDTPAENERDRHTLTKKAHQIMSRSVISVKPDAPVREAARLMLEKQISCLPVIDWYGKLVGILSWKDILGAIFQSDTK
jgi:acetoin utilization protein AcuB